MAEKIAGLEKLLMEELQDLMGAEKQLVRALPKMAKSARSEEVENAFREHLEMTKRQVQRLEQVFQSMDARSRSRACRGMRGIVEEGEEMISENRDESLLDLAILGGARKAEHYEMVAYESARSLARQLGKTEAARLLEETLKEEVQTDRQLAALSERLAKGASMARKEEASPETRRTSRSRGAGNAKAKGGGRTAERRSSRSTSGSRKSSGSQAAGRRTSRSAHPLIDHEEIRRWAAERQAQPACVRGAGGSADIGMIRLDFPGFSGESSLEPISWDDWFRKFDESNLALMVQETLASGEKSNFNKLVSRESAGERPRARSAR